MSIDLNDPWLRQRSRAMHEDLNATRDVGAQTDIIRRHLEAALSERGVAADDYAAHNDMLKDLYHAACPWPEPDSRMRAGMALMSPLDARPCPYPEDRERSALQPTEDPGAPEMTEEQTIEVFRRVLSEGRP